MEYKKITIIGGYTLISPEDEHLINEYVWFVDRDGYATAFIYNGKCTSVRLHNLIRQRTAEQPCIDHINRVPLDNRRHNLAAVTWKEQCSNRNQPRHPDTPYTQEQLRVPKIKKTPPASDAYKRLKKMHFIPVK